MELISEFNVNYIFIKNLRNYYKKSEFTKIAKYNFSIEKSLHNNNKKVENRIKAQFIIASKNKKYMNKCIICTRHLCKKNQ